ncbi:hypothetical protein ACJMK2_037743 [Sinanodonta woodiana]|uniref:Short-chain collagen C4 n=1 Tax=Sinanodonta woodiana TaxID=1069815 RepID=A0ABD3WNH8_SINWO
MTSNFPHIYENISRTSFQSPSLHATVMMVILCLLFAVHIVGVHLETTAELNSNDCPRFDYEYKLLERLIRIEFAQRDVDITLSELREKFQTIESDVSRKIEDIRRLIDHKSKGFGSTYVRWGRTICPGNASEIVYKGFAGGSHYTHPGSAADFLCLTDEPVWGKYAGVLSDPAYIYGVEYEHTFSTVSRNDDMPCCVCKTSRTPTIMIPGTTECYPGWTMEYNGYLMAGHHSQAGSTNFVCVDANPEVRSGGATDFNGHLAYLMQAICGSLPCPPYTEGRVLTCVVCSR